MIGGEELDGGFRDESIVECNFIFFFQAEDGIRDYKVTGVQTCALPIYGQTTSKVLQALTLYISHAISY